MHEILIGWTSDYKEAGRFHPAREPVILRGPGRLAMDYSRHYIRMERKSESDRSPGLYWVEEVSVRMEDQVVPIAVVTRSWMEARYGGSQMDAVVDSIEFSGNPDYLGIQVVHEEGTST